MVTQQTVKVSPYVFPGCVKILDAQRTTDKFSRNEIGNKEAGITVWQIIETVCSSFEITTDVPAKKNRTKQVVEPRKIIYYMIRRFMPHLTLKYIGCCLGLAQDHATVLHASQFVEDLMQVDTEYRNQVNGIEMQLHKLRQQNSYRYN